MKKLLFLFLDGVGLGANQPDVNPFARYNFSTLTSLSAGKRWLSNLSEQQTTRAIFKPVDANLELETVPQSATGQATIMTGLNVPQQLGYHYGPKPNPDVSNVIKKNSVIRRLTEAGIRGRLLNAYPDRFLAAIEQGKRLRSSNQLALHVGGINMPSSSDYLEGRAVSADFTGRMWKERLAETDAATIMWREHLKELPLRTPFEAGKHIVSLLDEVNFAFYDYWLTDYIGHRGTMEDAERVLKNLDGVLEGVLDSWDDAAGLIVITSDHGNIEDISERGHTRNAVPCVVIGKERLRFAQNIKDLSGFAPALLGFFGVE